MSFTNICRAGMVMGNGTWKKIGHEFVTAEADDTQTFTLLVYVYMFKFFHNKKPQIISNIKLNYHKPIFYLTKIKCSIFKLTHWMCQIFTIHKVAFFVKIIFP